MREHVLQNYHMVKQAGDDSFASKVQAGYTAARGYSPKETKQLGTRGYIVRQPKGLTHQPNEHTIKHRGKRYSYDHREYTHGTGKRLSITTGLLGAAAGLVGTGSAAGALGAGAIGGGGGYLLGRSMMNNLGGAGVKGLIDQKADYDLKRIKLREIK